MITGNLIPKKNCTKSFDFTELLFNLNGRNAIHCFGCHFHDYSYFPQKSIASLY